MRNLSQSMIASLQSGVTHLSWCWKLTRTDGIVSGFTDHDQDLVFDGLVWKAASGIAPGVIETALGFETDSAGTAGSVLHDTLSAEDLKSGLFDGARVEIWRVDWQNTDDRVGIWAGEIGDIQVENNAFQAELVSNSRKLERNIGRSFSKNCDAELGDTRCEKDITGPPWRTIATIETVIGPSSFTVQGLSFSPADWFVFGAVEWLDTEKTANHARIFKHYSSGPDEVFELLLSPRIPLESGDQIALIVGCDKTLIHCADRFANVGNFRGCPFMPGNDALLAIPLLDT